MRIEVFIILVFAVLQIILFFKIWGMTNDVRKLRMHFIPEIQDNKIIPEIQDNKTPYYFNVGEQVMYQGKVYDVIEILGGGMCKCMDIETGRYYSLKCDDLQVYK